MGLTRKPRKKYATPPHPWQAERIDEERKIKKGYGLKNKKEIWKVASLLKGFKDQAKKLTARTDPQAVKEKKALIERLNKIGLIQKDATMDNVLEISLENILERRLQSVVVSRGLARTMKQSRQMITHGHIKVGEKKMDVPSYIVSLQEEPILTFSPSSSFNDSEHPERAQEKEEVPKLKEQPKEEAVAATA